MKVVGRGRVVEDNPRLGPWRNAVTRVARSAWRGCQPLDGPVAVQLAFVLPLPASAPKSWASRPRWATPYRRGTGDVDKLSRAVLDALTRARVWADDAQVTRLGAVKVFGAAPGVRVVVGRGPSQAAVAKVIDALTAVDPATGERAPKWMFPSGEW